MNIRPSSSTGVLFALVYNDTVPLSVAVVTKEEEDAVSLFTLSAVYGHIFFPEYLDTLRCDLSPFSRTCKCSWMASLWQHWSPWCCATLKGWHCSWMWLPQLSRSQPTPPLSATWSPMPCRRHWSAWTPPCRTQSAHTLVGFQVS